MMKETKTKLHIIDTVIILVFLFFTWPTLVLNSRCALELTRGVTGGVVTIALSGGVSIYHLNDLLISIDAKLFLKTTTQHWGFPFLFLWSKYLTVNPLQFTYYTRWQCTCLSQINHFLTFGFEFVSINVCYYASVYFRFVLFCLILSYNLKINFDNFSGPWFWCRGVKNKSS